MPTLAEACETVTSIHAGVEARREERAEPALDDARLRVPRLDDMRVDAGAGKDVMAVLLPIWTAKTETAGRVRRRINAVMKRAVGQAHRADNPRRRGLPRVADRRRAARLPLQLSGLRRRVSSSLGVGQTGQSAPFRRVGPTRRAGSV